MTSAARPRMYVRAEHSLQLLRQAVEQHEQALLRATDSAEPLRQALASLLQRLFRLAGGTVIVTVRHLALVALGLERLRGGLARRRLFGGTDMIPRGSRTKCAVLSECRRDAGNGQRRVRGTGERSRRPSGGDVAAGHPGPRSALASRLFACYTRAAHVRVLPSVMGEESLPEVDPRFLAFGRELEERLIHQQDRRTLEDSMRIG